MRPPPVRLHAPYLTAPRPLPLSLQSDGTAADTNLRVLVTHYNGMQEVVAVENDMGLDASNAEAVKARLREQGVKDIMAVETE